MAGDQLACLPFGDGQAFGRPMAARAAPASGERSIALADAGPHYWSARFALARELVRVRHPARGATGRD